GCPGPLYHLSTGWVSSGESELLGPTTATRNASGDASPNISRPFPGPGVVGPGVATTAAVGAVAAVGTRTHCGDIFHQIGVVDWVSGVVRHGGLRVWIGWRAATSG